MSEVALNEQLEAANQDSQANTLYVIFHGSIAFFDDGVLPWIEALIPDVKDDHVYLCGDFLTETRIPCNSELTLAGVTAGDDYFRKYSGNYFDFSGAIVALDGVHSRFRFPRPRKIYHCNNYTTGNAGDLMISTSIVLEYRFSGKEDVKLRVFRNYAASCADNPNHPRASQFWSLKAQTVAPYTLHIRAEEEFGSAKRTQDLTAAGTVLGVQNQVSAIDLTLYNQYGSGDPIPGLDGRQFWEVGLTLNLRLEWLRSRVVPVIQQNPPQPDGSFEIQAPSVRLNNDSSCGPISGSEP